MERFYAIGNVLPNNCAQLGCDTEADIAYLPDYAKSQHLSPGSTCLVQETSEVYMMKTDGTWDTL